MEGDLNIYRKWKITSNIFQNGRLTQIVLKMEDNLMFFENERGPQLFENERRPQLFS